jgi:hypothetical protein
MKYMSPLSLFFRRAIAIIFFVLFAILLFITFVYASGYWLSDTFSLEQTGGVHVTVPLTGATVFLNGEPVGISTFLDRSFFIDRVKPGTHSVSVAYDGYRQWEKNLIVERAYVSDTVAFLIPDEIAVRMIEVGTTTVSTTTRLFSPDEAVALEALFATTTSTSTGGMPVKSQENEPIEIVIREGNLFVRWNRDLARAPHSFCITPRACVKEISIEIDPIRTERAEFYRDGIVYQTAEGIFFSEIDVKEPRASVPLYEGLAEFRIQNDEIIIRAGDTRFAVEKW